MKKILTLMTALSAVAGSAMANDFNFEVNGTPSVDDQGYVAGTKNELHYASNKYTFNANDGDNIKITSTGIITVKVNGKLIAGNKGVYAVKEDGEITVELTNGAIVSKIVVVSSATRSVEKKYNKEAVAAVNEANAKTAKYANIDGEGETIAHDSKNLLGGFFTAVRAKINEQGAEIQAVKALLERCQEANTVAANKVDLENRLDAAITKINNIVAEAQAKYDLYLSVVNIDSKDAIDKIKKATAEPSFGEVVGGVNDRPVYIYDYKVEKMQVVKTGPKTAWIEQEWKGVEADIINIKDAVVTELANFPDCLTPAKVTLFKKMFNDLAQEGENVIQRAIFDRAHRTEIENLEKQMKGIEEVAAIGTPFALPEDPNEYEAWKEVVGNLVSVLNAENDRRLVTKDALDRCINDGYTPAKQAFDLVEKLFIKQAEQALVKKGNNTQNYLNETAYNVSAKYENEPNTQKEKERVFAEIQQDLDAIKAAAATDANYVNAAEGASYIGKAYKNFVSQFDGIRKRVGSEWDVTVSAQKQEVLDNNTAVYNDLITRIENVRAYYNLNVLRIKEWIDKDWTNKTTEETLEAYLKNLFSIVGGVDEMKTTVSQAYTEIQEKVRYADEVEFNANKNDYRLLKGQKDQYIAKIDKVNKDIEAEIRQAVFKANLIAADYLRNTWIVSANGKIDEAKGAVDAGEVTSVSGSVYNTKMSKYAVKAFLAEYTKVAEKDADGNGYGYVEFAENEIAAHYKTDIDQMNLTMDDLADRVVDIQKVLEEQVPEAIRLINVELESYKRQYEKIYAAKVQWSVAKANAATHQTVVGDAFVVIEKLDKVNAELTAAYSKLEANPVNASELEEKTKVALDKFEKDMFRIEHYDIYVKNEASKVEVADQIMAVEAALTVAYDQIKDYFDEVKADATQQLDAAKLTLKTYTDAINVAKEGNDFNDKYESTFKAQLEAVNAEIASILATAEKANKDLDLDYNKDGEVNLKDAIDAKEAAQDSGDITVFMGFVDRLLDKMSK